MKPKTITKVTLLTILAISIMAAVTLNSCQKEKVTPPSKSKTTNAVNTKTNPMSIATMLFDQFGSVMMGSAKHTKDLIPNLYSTDSSGCAIITLDTLTKPYSITYNYGSGCVGSDGLTRSGVVTITANDTSIRTVNNAFTLTLQNYGILNEVSNVNGSLSMTNIGPNIRGNIVLTQTGGFTAQMSGVTDTVSVNYAYEWLAGENTYPLADLQFSITGQGMLTFSDGTPAQSLTITSALIKNSKTPGCNYYISGTDQIVNAGADTLFNNYGTPGQCTGQYQQTENGTTTTKNQ